MRKPRPVNLAAGALILAVPGSAVALAAGQADAQGAIQIAAGSHHVSYGDELKVTGVAATASPGQSVALEFAPAGSSTWHTLASTHTGSAGDFAFRVPVRQSGLVRAVEGAAIATGSRTAVGASDIGLAPSNSQAVSVAPEFRLDRDRFEVLSGQTLSVRGKLLPGVGGRRVRLQGRYRGAWRTLASTRTGRSGRFDLRYPAGGVGAEQLRVAFRGDRLNSRISRTAGRLLVFRESIASWYYDGGNTACGFHAGMGVANRVLPCGTKVTFRYGGRTVTAVVDDRGPFVGGREWDLNQNTAGALGFGGVGAVWSTS
jgi:hypothetical protein